jgi:hypothetical protein
LSAERPERVARGAHRALDLDLVGRVHDVADRTLGEPGRGDVEPFGVDVAEHHARAGLDERRRDGVADARRGAGHHRRLALQAVVTIFGHG